MFSKTHIVKESKRFLTKKIFDISNMELVLNKKTWGGSLQVEMFFRSFVNVGDYTYTWGVGVGSLTGYG